MSALLVLVIPLLSFKAISTVKVAGTIQEDTVWTIAESPYYIIGDVYVLTDVTLIIEAGVEIIFHDDYEILIKGGFLKVFGTAKQSVSFISILEGSKCMLIFKDCDLSQSSIISAKFSGSKPAVQLTHLENSQTQNKGALTMKFCLFMEGSHISSNGPINPLSSTDDDSSLKSSLILHNVLIYKSKLTTNYLKENQPVYIKNSYIINSTLQLIGYESVSLLSSCFIENTEIEFMFITKSSAAYIDDSTLINVHIKSNISFKKMNGLLSIRGTIFQHGSILGVLTGVDVLIEESKFQYVDIESSEKSHDYYIASFTLRNSIYHHGLISMMDHQTVLISSDITLDKSPLILGDKSKILCSLITREIETKFNVIGIEAQHVTIKGSSIYNFEIGIRVFEESIISSNNIYANSLYNIENQGEYDIQATGNWWGTYIEEHISDKIHDNASGIGKIIYSDYSFSIIEHQNSDCSEDIIAIVDSNIKTGTITPGYKSVSSINYPSLVVFYSVLISFFYCFSKIN